MLETAETVGRRLMSVNAFIKRQDIEAVIFSKTNGEPVRTVHSPLKDRPAVELQRDCVRSRVERCCNTGIKSVSTRVCEYAEHAIASGRGDVKPYRNCQVVEQTIAVRINPKIL